MAGLMPRERRWQRRLIVCALLLCSICLHALLLGELAGGSFIEHDRPAPPDRPVTFVRLVVAPSSPTVVADVRPAPAAALPPPISRAQRRAERGGVERWPAPALTTAAGSDAPALTPTQPVQLDDVTAAALVELHQTDPALPAQRVAASSPQADAASATLPDQVTDLSVQAPVLPPLPESHARRFKVYWGDFEGGQSVARIRYRLTVEGDSYEVRTEGEAEGLISLVYSGTLTQVSIGMISPAGLMPVRYSESRGRGAVRSVDFDPEALQLRPQGGAPLAVPRGVQDRLSVFYQLGLMARAQPAEFVVGREVLVPVASLRDVRMERFTVMGDAVLMAPGAAVRALHLHRAPPPGSRDPKIDLWLGYDHQMLPVRLRIEDSAQRVLDQLVDSAE